MLRSLLAWVVAVQWVQRSARVQVLSAPARLPHGRGSPALQALEEWQQADPAARGAVSVGEALPGLALPLPSESEAAAGPFAGPSQQHTSQRCLGRAWREAVEGGEEVKVQMCLEFGSQGRAGSLHGRLARVGVVRADDRTCGSWAAPRAAWAACGHEEVDVRRAVWTSMSSQVCPVVCFFTGITRSRARAAALGTAAGRWAAAAAGRPSSALWSRMTL
jgi:hypothetical protein